MERQAETIQALVRIYCRGEHGAEPAPCPQCQELLDYALARLERCPYMPHKPTCRRCPIHCYAPRMRERITAVMRYAGPRLLWRRPDLALGHLWDTVQSGQRIARREKDR